jgi:multiple sugar transport system ATP-binding protein
LAEVRLVNLKKVYEGNVVAVQGVNLTVKNKEFVVLVGPSGCGKSTTLRMVAGLEEISEGELYIDNKLMNNVPPKNRDIAMVFQNYALYPHMNVFDNMAFGLKIRKFPKDEIKRRVEDAANILGIENLLYRKPKQLSGGQRQRVAVGRAIVRKPKIFLFDEPLSNLDAKLRVQMRTEISKLHQRLEATMIYVTHDQIEAMTMGDRIVVMKDGIVHQIDTPLNLYYHPANKFVAGFIGSPSMNFIRGLIRSIGGLKFNSIGNGLQINLETSNNKNFSHYINREIILGIRPENFEIQKDRNKDSDRASIQADIEVVEPMGSEQFLYFQIDSEQFVAKVDSSLNVEAGKKVVLVFSLSQCHFFDAENEKSI